MSEEKQPEKKRASRLCIYWGVALALLIAAGLFCWLVVVPVWRTRRVVFAYSGGVMNAEAAVRELGGPKQATDEIVRYLRMPEWIREEHTRAMTSDKTRHAMYLLTHCGRPGIAALIGFLNEGSPYLQYDDVVDVLEVAAMSADKDVRKAAGEALIKIKAAQKDKQP